MITIKEASAEHIIYIQAVAKVAWPVAFAEILSAEQIGYMMEMMYSYEALREQMETKGHRFFIAMEGDEPVGYMSIEHNCEDSGRTKIHKAYILPERQRVGIGGRLFDRACEEARIKGDGAVYLNVNKYNKSAIAFYNKGGFDLIKEEVIDIGNGYVMDDYVFEKKL